MSRHIRLGFVLRRLHVLIDQRPYLSTIAALPPGVSGPRSSGLPRRSLGNPASRTVVGAGARSVLGVGGCDRYSIGGQRSVSAGYLRAQVEAEGIQFAVAVASGR